MNWKGNHFETNTSSTTFSIFYLCIPVYTIAATIVVQYHESYSWRFFVTFFWGWLSVTRKNLQLGAAQKSHFESPGPWLVGG